MILSGQFLLAFLATAVPAKDAPACSLGGRDVFIRWEDTSGAAGFVDYLSETFTVSIEGGGELLRVQRELGTVHHDPMGGTFDLFAPPDPPPASHPLGRMFGTFPSPVLPPRGPSDLRVSCDRAGVLVVQGAGSLRLVFHSDTGKLAIDPAIERELSRLEGTKPGTKKDLASIGAQRDILALLQWPGGERRGAEDPYLPRVDLVLAKLDLDLGEWSEAERRLDQLETRELEERREQLRQRLAAVRRASQPLRFEKARQLGELLEREEDGLFWNRGLLCLALDSGAPPRPTIRCAEPRAGALTERPIEALADAHEGGPLFARRFSLQPNGEFSATADPGRTWKLAEAIPGLQNFGAVDNASVSGDRRWIAFTTQREDEPRQVWLVAAPR